MNQLQSYYEKLVSKHVESKAALKCFLSMMSAFVEKKDVQNFISLQKMCHQYNVNSDDIGGEDLKAKEIMFSSLLREKCGHQIQVLRRYHSAYQLVFLKSSCVIPIQSIMHSHQNQRGLNDTSWKNWKQWSCWDYGCVLDSSLLFLGMSYVGLNTKLRLGMQFKIFSRE